MTAEDGAKAGARLREMMDANRADRERRQDECGFTACVDRHQAALNAEYEAAQVILTTAPTTMAGVVAVIRYAAELEKVGEFTLFMDGDDTRTLFTTLDTALARVKKA